MQQAESLRDVRNDIKETKDRADKAYKEGKEDKFTTLCKLLVPLCGLGVLSLA